MEEELQKLMEEWRARSKERAYDDYLDGQNDQAGRCADALEAVLLKHAAAK